MRNFFLLLFLGLVPILTSSCSSKLQTENVLQHISAIDLEIESSDSRYLEYAPYFENEFFKIKSLRQNDNNLKYLLLVKIESNYKRFKYRQKCCSVNFGLWNKS